MSLIPFGGDAVGVRTEALEYSLDGETLTVGVARGVSTSASERARPSASNAVRSSLSRPLLRSRHEHARGRRPGTGGRPRRPIRRRAPPLRPGRPVDDPLLLSQGRHARLHDRGRGFRDSNETIVERGADVWGVSPQDGASKRAFTEKFGLPFTLLADTDHKVAETYGTWVEKENYGKKYWGTARVTFLLRSRRPYRPGLAEGEAEGHAAEVLAALDAEQAVRVG